MGTAVNPVLDGVATAPPLPLAAADPPADDVGTAAEVDGSSLADGIADGLAAAEDELEGPAALVVGTCDVDSEVDVGCGELLGVLVASVGIAAEVTCSPVGDRPVGVGVLSVAAADEGSTTTVTAVGIESPPGEETEDEVAAGDVTEIGVGAAEEDKVEGIGAEGEGASLLVGTAEVAEDAAAEDDAAEDDADKEVAASEVVGIAEVEGTAEVVDGSTDVTASLDWGEDAASEVERTVAELSETAVVRAADGELAAEDEDVTDDEAAGLACAVDNPVWRKGK